MGLMMRFRMPYKQLTFKPMVGLLNFLRDDDFNVCIVSGGGRDFIRVRSGV